MSLVIDSSLLVAALVDTSAAGSWAERALEGQPLYAPELIYADATNILRRLEHATRITPPEADAAQGDLMQLEITVLPFEHFAHRIWELRHTVASYDAWYVAVAEGLEFPLATLDGHLARATGPKCKFLTPDSDSRQS